MKTKKRLLFVSICVLLSASLALFTACPDDDDPPPLPGFAVTVVINNTSMGSAAVTPLLQGGRQEAGVLMTVNVTPANNHRVVSVTVPGPGNVQVTTVTPNAAYTFIMPNRAASVNVNFEEIPEPPNPNRDLAWGSTEANAWASNLRTTAPATPITQAFDGNWNSFAQIQGGANLEHWFAVDLGYQFNEDPNVQVPHEIQVVRIGWGMSEGAFGNFNGMVNYVIQVSNTELPVPGTYDDTGWTTVATITDNPGNESSNVRNLQNRVNTIVLDTPVSARFVRIKQTAGLNDSGPEGPDRPWTNWPSVSIFQVFATEVANIPAAYFGPNLVAPISNKPIGSAGSPIVPPVRRGVPPVLNAENLAQPGFRFDARLTEISPAPTGGFFAPNQVYTYYFTLTADTGYFFNAATPAITVAPTAAGATTVVSINGVDPAEATAPFLTMVVSRVFPITETNVIDTLAFTLGAPFTGGSVPTSANLAPSEALYSGTIVIQESADGIGGWTNFSSATFAQSMFYRYNITLTAAEHFVFLDNITIPEVGGKTATDRVQTTDTLSFTFTFDQTELPSAVNMGTNLVAAGLTARLELSDGTTTGNFATGEAVRVHVIVTGESERATIFTAQLNSSEVSDFTFVPGVDLGAGALSSHIATRNIGGIGRGAPLTGGWFTGAETGERIGQDTGAIMSQPANHWTFVFEFVMPDEDVMLNLVNTFRHDIAPAIVTAADGENVRASTTSINATVPLANLVRNVFSGNYGWASGDQHDRWVALTSAPNSWIVIDLGAEYDITDVVLRWHSGNAFPSGGFRIDVRSGGITQAEWDEGVGSEGWEGWTEWVGTAADAPAIGETDTQNGWRTAWSLLGRTAGGGNLSRYTAFFKGESGSIANLQNSGANGALGPWQPRGLDMGTLAASPAPLRGRFVKLHAIGAPIAGVGNSIWNFEIYGTPAP